MARRADSTSSRATCGGRRTNAVRNPGLMHLDKVATWHTRSGASAASGGGGSADSRQ